VPGPKPLLISTLCVGDLSFEHTNFEELKQQHLVISILDALIIFFRGFGSI
jgi:hypothetical protein